MDDRRSGGFNRRGGGGGGFGGPREMHKATCSDCGQETEVPFKPIEGRPVYCRDCYQKHKFDRKPSFRREGSDSDAGAGEE